MSDSKLQRWALTAEIIGGAAIVISLLFVGYEVRQSTKEAALNRKALELATYQNLIQSIHELNALVIDSPGFAELFVDTENYETMSKSDQQKINTYLMSVYRHGDLAYFQFKQRVIEKEQLDSILKRVTFTITDRPAGKLIWDARKQDVFSKDYTDYVDTLMKEAN